MADDLENRGKLEDIRINVTQSHELAYWTQALGCSGDDCGMQ